MSGFLFILSLIGAFYLALFNEDGYEFDSKTFELLAFRSNHNLVNKT